MNTDAVAEWRAAEPGRVQPAGQPGSRSVVCVTPTGRAGRLASPIEQARVALEQVYVGIDVSKDRLDVHVHPLGEAFAVERSGAGLEELIARLRPLLPVLVALEATGGFETVAAAALAGPACRWRWSIRHRCAITLRRSGEGPRPTRSTPR